MIWMGRDQRLADAMQPSSPPHGLLLIGLLAGFFFLAICRWTRFHCLKLQGYRLFLWAAATGLFLVALSRLIVVGLRLLTAGTSLGPSVDQLRSLVATYAEFNHAGTAIGSLLLAFSLGLASYLLVSEHRALLRAAGRKDALLHLFLGAYEAWLPIQVTLKTRKTYVGYVIFTAKLEPEMPYFRLVPTLSGYRTEDELYLELPTLYEESEHLVWSFLKGEAKAEDILRLEQLQIVLRREEIVSASFFDKDLFDKHCDLRDLELKEALGEERLHEPDALDDAEDVQRGVLPVRYRVAGGETAASRTDKLLAYLLAAALALLAIAQLALRREKPGRAPGGSA